MGTLSLVAGIIILLIGLYFFFEGVAWIFLSFFLVTAIGLPAIIIGGTMIAVGSLLISKYDADKREERIFTKDNLDSSPFKCEHCKFIGVTEEVLWNHYNDKHPDEKKW